MVTEYLISELAQHSHYDFMQILSVEVVEVELWSIAWEQCTVIWNLRTSLFQLLSNIFAYKNHNVYIFFCKVLSVVFKASSTILSMSKGRLVIPIVHARTTYDVLLLPLPPPPPFKNLMKIFYLSFCFTACRLTPFPSSCSLWSLCH